MSKAHTAPAKERIIADIAHKTLLLFNVYVLGSNREIGNAYIAREGFIGKMGKSATMGNGHRGE